MFMFSVFKSLIRKTPDTSVLVKRDTYAGSQTYNSANSSSFKTKAQSTQTQSSQLLASSCFKFIRR